MGYTTRQTPGTQVKKLYRHLRDLIIMNSKPSGHPKNEVSDREIVAYARSPKEWSERYLNGMPIRQPPDNPKPSRLDDAMLAAARSSRRLTGYVIASNLHRYRIRNDERIRSWVLHMAANIAEEREKLSNEKNQTNQ